MFKKLASLATIIQPTRDAIIGGNFRLECIAAVGSRAMTTPIIMWSGPNGAIMETNPPEGVMLESSNTTGTYTSALNFIPLRASHKGNYTCQVQFQQNIESSSRYLDVTGIIIHFELWNFFYKIFNIIYSTKNSNNDYWFR